MSETLTRLPFFFQANPLIFVNIWWRRSFLHAHLRNYPACAVKNKKAVKFYGTLEQTQIFHAFHPLMVCPFTLSYYPTRQFLRNA